MGKTDQPTSGSVSRFLRRAFVKERPFLWSPGRIGPQFEWLDYTHIRFREGALKGSRFELVTEILETKANVYISEQGSQVARACVERDPPGKGVCLSEIAVDEPYRRKGLASIMTYCIFRELLAMQETAFFKIRMMRMLKPTERNVEVQNVGIGVIANRLGFTPELIVEKILSPSNVTGIEILPAKGDFPPSFKIVVRTFPLVAHRVRARRRLTETGRRFPYLRQALEGAADDPRVGSEGAHRHRQRQLLAAPGRHRPVRQPPRHRRTRGERVPAPCAGRLECPPPFPGLRLDSRPPLNRAGGRKLTRGLVVAILYT